VYPIYSKTEHILPEYMIILYDHISRIFQNIPEFGFSEFSNDPPRATPMFYPATEFTKMVSGGTTLRKANSESN
jgi:hypothetical protein